MADIDNQLCPDIPMSDRDMKAGLERLAKLRAVTPAKSFQVALDELEASDKSSVTRSKLAVLLTQLLFPQWLLP